MVQLLTSPPCQLAVQLPVYSAFAMANPVPKCWNTNLPTYSNYLCCASDIAAVWTIFHIFTYYAVSDRDSNLSPSRRWMRYVLSHGRRLHTWIQNLEEKLRIVTTNFPKWRGKGLYYNLVASNVATSCFTPNIWNFDIFSPFPNQFKEKTYNHFFKGGGVTIFVGCFFLGWGWYPPPK